MLLPLFFEATLGPEIWALIGVLVGGLLTGLINYLLQRSQFKHNKEMYYLQNTSRENVKDYLIELLNHKKYPERKYVTLRKRIGAYSDDDLRILLTEVGAIKSQAKDGTELWYLKERNDERKNAIKKGYN
ncbi:hypothetical protein RQM59_07085 [Flavobacteriaceae bacterium S356]|uniref:Uncharacterized protein n=1 Tax=Asprobacillus argus TaxID=3076534 RepID=A0ABU3LEK3_9FLAO|nr:hypothetical protein [Flavobacteriaceae bacterium S356]